MEASFAKPCRRERRRGEESRVRGSERERGSNPSLFGNFHPFIHPLPPSSSAAASKHSTLCSKCEAVQKICCSSPNGIVRCNEFGRERRRLEEKDLEFECRVTEQMKERGVDRVQETTGALRPAKFAL